MHKKLAITLAAGVLLLGGCQDELLEKQPVDKFSEEMVWTDPNLVEAFVNSKYRDLGWGFGESEYLWSSLSDESMFKHDYGTHVVNRGEVTPANLGVADAWGKNYRYIRDCNLFLEKIGTAPVPAGHKDRLTGEIRFIRAFRYFDLVRNYGSVPLITRSFGLNDDFTQVQRNPLPECLDFIVTECDGAAALLPEVYEGRDVGRATRGAALALKARTLLYAASPLYTGGASDPAKWRQAAEAAKAVIDLGQYGLHPDYAGLFLTPRNGEIIFDKANVASEGLWLHLELFNGPNGYGGWAGNMPLQNLVDAYEMASGRPITDPTSGYDPQNPYANRDPRFYASILHNGAPYKGRPVETFLPGGKDSPDGPEPWNTSLTGYYLRKFVNEAVDNWYDWSVNNTTPWIYFRYGEVLLNYAEAQNEAAGPDATVYESMNALRARAGMPPLPAGLSREAMRERIQRERQVELAFEEHRYYDVRRWRIADRTENEPARGAFITRNPDGTFAYRYGSVQQRQFSERNYWLPIPLKETQANPGLRQNGGW